MFKRFIQKHLDKIKDLESKNYNLRSEVYTLEQKNKFLHSKLINTPLTINDIKECPVLYKSYSYGKIRVLCQEGLYTLNEGIEYIRQPKEFKDWIKETLKSENLFISQSDMLRYLKENNYYVLDKET